MEDINNYIKENDTDNVILNKLKELGTKLTGQDNVQGETVAEVLDFINANYSGGGSGSKTVFYINVHEIESGLIYAYKDESCTIKADMNELYNACENGCIFIIGSLKFLPCAYNIFINPETGKPDFAMASAVDDKIMYIYSSEYMNQTGEIQ